MKISINITAVVRAMAKLLLISMMVLMVYLFTSLFVELPFPKFYKDWQKANVEKRMANDPFLKMTNTAISVIKQRDSLQHIVDSLTTKK
jgi:hypothetical protein